MSTMAGNMTRDRRSELPSSDNCGAMRLRPYGTWKLVDCLLHRVGCTTVMFFSLLECVQLQQRSEVNSLVVDILYISPKVWHRKICTTDVCPMGSRAHLQYAPLTTPLTFAKASCIIALIFSNTIRMPVNHVHLSLSAHVLSPLSLGEESRDSLLPPHRLSNQVTVLAQPSFAASCIQAIHCNIPPRVGYTPPWRVAETDSKGTIHEGVTYATGR